MKKVIATVATAAVALAAAGGAAATTMSLPSFRSDLIVPNHSIGGVVLKSGAPSAVRALGAAGRSCSVTRGCTYEKDGAEFLVQFAQLQRHSKPIVAEISMSVSDKLIGGHEVPQFDTPLTSLKTSSGIGLGSTASAVKRAYPKAKGSDGAAYSLVGPDAHATTFSLTDGRVSSIEMQGVHVG